MWLNIANKHNINFAIKFFKYYHRFGRWTNTKLYLKVADAQTYEIEGYEAKTKFCKNDGQYCLDQRTKYGKNGF